MSKDREMALLELCNVSASYGEENVVRGISLTVKPSEVVCLAGESGSGKSTLLKMIHGLEKVYMTEGRILFDGQELCRAGAGRSSQKACGRIRRALAGREIGLIPQNPGASFNPIRRFDAQLRECLSSQGREYSEKEVLDIFEKMDLKDGAALLRGRPFEMSGGMNQRIAIAAAMLLRPRLLLCDEVTSALDVTTAVRVTDELLRMNRELGTAILMVTHHIGVARRMASRIGILRNGCLVEEGPAEKILQHPEQEYTKKLLENVPRMPD